MSDLSATMNFGFFNAVRSLKFRCWSGAFLGEIQMTSQRREHLFLDGQWVELMSTPFYDLLERCGRTCVFQRRDTSLARGYVGSWAIEDDRLYMVGIDEAVYPNWTPATLQDFFPGMKLPVFAEWFTGRLRVPRGPQLWYHHMGFGSQYEEDLFLYVKKGVVKKRRVVKNKIPEGMFDEEGNLVGAPISNIWKNMEDEE